MTDALSELSLAEGEGEGLAPLFQQAITTSNAPCVYLVELYPYQQRLASSSDVIDAIGDMAISALGDGQESEQGIAQLCFSDCGYTTSPSDAVPNTHYEGRVSVPMAVEQQLPISPEADRRSALQFGTMEILNGDGYLYSVMQNYSIDGRRVRVLIGQKTNAYADFGTIFDGVSTGWQGDQGSVQISLRDFTYLLDIPLQQQLYAGTGGLEGTSDNQGKPKPLAFGVVRNITPVLIDPSNLVFQVSSRVINAVTAVYSNGAGVTASGTDYPDYASLIAASITAGQYVTCLALGLFRINFSSSGGAITADVQGDAFGGYISDASNIARRIVKDFGGLLDAAINTGSFDQLATVQPGIIGWYSNNQAVSVADAVNQIMGGIGAFWFADFDGRITVGRLEEPDASNPAFIFDETDILSVDILSLPDNLYPANWRRRVGYQRNWTVQTGEGLAGSITADRRNFLKEEQRIAYAVNASVQSRHLLATDPAPVPGLLDNMSDAQTEANRELNLYSVERQYIAVKLKRSGYLGLLNRSGLVTWSSFNLARKAMRVVGRGLHADRNEVTLYLWG